MNNPIIACHVRTTNLAYGNSLDHVYFLHENGNINVKIYYSDNEGNTFKEEDKTIEDFNLINVELQKKLVENIAGGLIEQHRWLNSML